MLLRLRNTMPLLHVAGQQNVKLFEAPIKETMLQKTKNRRVHKSRRDNLQHLLGGSWVVLSYK